MSYDENMGKLRAGDTDHFRSLDAVMRANKGEELRVRRVLAGLKQANVARYAGMSQQCLSNYEKGRRKPSAASRENVLKAIEGLRLPATINRVSRSFAGWHGRTGRVP
jgi:DNA-binding transcriptional regulator YiaG